MTSPSSVEKLSFEHDDALLSQPTKPVAKDLETSSFSSGSSNNEGNILTQYSEEQTEQMGKLYAAKYGLDVDLFGKAALLARLPNSFNSMSFLSDEQKSALNKEITQKWSVPFELVKVIFLSSMTAAVQGMDETVINGATLFYPEVMGVTNMKNADLIEGLINGAPYLCASCIACWLSDLWNKKLGRRWTIFWACSISAITCIWQALVNLKWYHLFLARFFLGFGVGINSATVPAYAAEAAPSTIRGSLVMLWQFFTAVGMMFGYVSSLAFYHVGHNGISGGLNWRLMLGSACIPALIVMVQAPFVPESPRWLMGKDRHLESFNSLNSLRNDPILAARDTFYQYVLLKEEGSVTNIPTYKRLIEMFTIRRNRNGALGAWIVMFMQQFCGINAIAYYSSSIFKQAHFSNVQAMLASWGFGMLNFLFAIPAFYTIDTWGRRKLLLLTFPLMSLFLFMAGFGFLCDDKDGKVGIVATGIYLFTCVYSSGEGPVPFTYSAEAFPLYIRDLGMGFATATCWFFNFILAFTWPRLVNAFTPTGAFCWYAGWNVVGFFLVLWFLPETKGLTLEELDEVFSIPTMTHAKWQTKEFILDIRRVVFKQDVIPQEPLYSSHRMAVTNPIWNDKSDFKHVE
ncbi:hypothetical protein HYPBUDRAFT_108363 [Hyphopichia burtonii NRRL Y-1933]|uniref:Major facilitator superfamily (MFS) profile domain-containing protein n=1 Tax=Hyphopichia burtonii NRRL Y-1933 TaxID=984485 RepID=A0A1E4RJK0_9ASCO|nr:hypothetical protein HYPBUDRAFT_108363 [Hyphopichia burtonii NRRL Y-1933]ODV67454.1 hypothetical protein HYPBUDRAFT_108363 [Hyphopichia burtonii NRRL Y-1933]